MPQEGYNPSDNPQYSVLVSRMPEVDLRLEVRNGYSFLELRVPKIREGIQRSEDEQGLALIYWPNGSVSSNSKDYLAASAKSAGSHLEVALSRPEGPGPIVEGRFIATCITLFGEATSRLSGRFRLRLAPE